MTPPRVIKERTWSLHEIQAGGIAVRDDLPRPCRIKGRQHLQFILEHMYLPFTATMRLAGGRALIVPEYVLYNIVTNCPFYGQADSHTFSHDLFSPTLSSIIKSIKAG
jgi:hypothetical protein